MERIMNHMRCACALDPLMPEVAADPLFSSVLLFSKADSRKFSDLILISRARVRVLRG
jgi:hypothetical protein